MAEFTEAIRLRFAADVETVLKGVLAAKYSLDEIIEIVYLFHKYTADAFVDEKAFKESGHYLGIKTLIAQMKVIWFENERYLGRLPVDEPSDT